jgi:hypothetical protein
MVPCALAPLKIYCGDDECKGPARPGICPMLGSLRFAFLFFSFLSFFLNNQLIRIDLAGSWVRRFECVSDFVAELLSISSPVLRPVRGGLLFINHNGRTWMRDLMLHGGRGNRGVGWMGRTREIASTHGRRGHEGRRKYISSACESPTAAAALRPQRGMKTARSPAKSVRQAIY